MILNKVTIENFRQFRGRQELYFSTVSNRNVTLVHAENGFGKTALLNALLWGFYGHEGLSEELQKKGSIIHESTAARSKKPSAVAAKVTIWFTHDSEKYRLERELTLAQQQIDSRKTDLVLEVNRDGMPYVERKPQERILAFMPIGISEFLFFNGEGIEHLAREENTEKITAAIRQMLGLNLLQAAIKDLRSPSPVYSKLREELRERTSANKAAKIQEQSSVDDEIEEWTTRLKNNQESSQANESNLFTVNSKLESNRESHHLQVRRSELEKQQSRLEEQKVNNEKRLGQIVAEDGFSLFAGELITRGREIVNRLRSENKIPAPVLNSFLQELLDRHKCICMRHLNEGSPEREDVEALLHNAGDQQFNNAVGALDNALGRIEEAAEKTYATLQETNASRLRLRDELEDISDELKKISLKVTGKDDEEVNKLEASREKILLKQRELIAEQGIITSKLEGLKKRHGELREEIKQIEDGEADARKAQRRLTAVEDAANLLERILDIETAELRPVLNKEIQQHFQKIIGKAFWAELSEDFKLRIMKQIITSEPDDEVEHSEKREVALSEGERQVTALVFIASLLALARRRSEIPTIISGLMGSEYPLVMDSPFGQLSQFRQGVARRIPELAPQVIIFVSSSQFEGTVADELIGSKRIGKRYYLTYHGPNIHPEAKRELQISRNVVTVYFEEKNDEFTEICELET
jgi:DNA sulfur modification protein DndD